MLHSNTCYKAFMLQRKWEVVSIYSYKLGKRCTLNLVVFKDQNLHLNCCFKHVQNSAETGSRLLTRLTH